MASVGLVKSTLLRRFNCGQSHQHRKTGTEIPAGYAGTCIIIQFRAYSNSMKPVIWMGSSKEDLIAFPDEVRREIGYQLEHVQEGIDPDDWKPMSTVGAGVREIRAREASGAFRCIYLATRPEGIYVLHCFQKKTQKTRQQDLDLAQKRLKSIRVNHED
jgi:phage-related protein